MANRPEFVYQMKLNNSKVFGGNNQYIRNNLYINSNFPLDSSLPFLDSSIALSNILDNMISFLLKFLWSECASLVKSAGVMTGELRAGGP